MRDIALVPESDVLEADVRCAAHDAREAADALGGDRIALVRHRRRALLTGCERLLDLAHLRAREVTDLEAKASSEEATTASTVKSSACRSRWMTCVEGGRAPGRGARTRGARAPGRGRVRADGAGELADSHSLECASESCTSAIELERPPGELQAERRRLGMDAVRATHDQRPAVLLCPGDDGVGGAVKAHERAPRPRAPEAPARYRARRRT